MSESPRFLMPSELKDVHEIVMTYSYRVGLHGLFNEIAGCGCRVEDMGECDHTGVEQCQLGHVVHCEYCPRNSEEECTGPGGPGGTFCVFRELPTKEAADE